MKTRVQSPGVARLTVVVLVATALIVTLAGYVAADGIGGDNRPESRAAPARPEDPRYAAAVKAIDASKFAEAIPLLEQVVGRDAANADAYNWLAYAVRRNGDPAASVPIYQKALAIDPKHRGAHEYVGEAYLALGDLAKAKEHLGRLDALCFFPCSQYRDLKKAIQDYERSGGKSSSAADK